MNNLPALIALLKALQNAKEGSRELDERCLRAVGKLSTVSNEQWHDDEDVSHVSKIRCFNKAQPTRSVDDALDCMVPETAPLYADIHNNNARVCLWGRYHGEADGEHALARALCAARIEQLIGESDD